jgi:hypothetical protein
MSRTVWPWPDIITTIARRIRTGSFDVLVIRCSLRPSSMDSDRTNTLGLRATPHLLHSTCRQGGRIDQRDQLPDQRCVSSH